MSSRITAKERGLIKGALRRTFSRSELRKQAIDASRIDHIDFARPRVTKWSRCPDCGNPTPTYLMEVDHVNPVVKVTETLEDISWDELIENRIWCSSDNLRAVCKPCHKLKSKAEAKERREHRKLTGKKTRGNK